VEKPPGTNVLSRLDISSPSPLSSLYPSHFSSSHLFLLILSSRRAVTAADELQEPLRPAAAPLLRTPRRLRRRPLKASRKAAREKQAGEVSVRRLAAGVWRLRPPEAVPGVAAGSVERRVRVGVEAPTSLSGGADPVPACRWPRSRVSGRHGMRCRPLVSRRPQGPLLQEEERRRGCPGSRAPLHSSKNRGRSQEGEARKKKEEKRTSSLTIDCIECMWD